MSFSPQKPRLVFLYSELADYFLACIRKLTTLYDIEVHIIHWPVNKEAPFAFNFPDGVTFYNRNQFNAGTLKEKLKSIEPDFIYCSGWMDKEYLSAVRGYKDKIPVVIGLDTKWQGTLRQHFACLLSSFTLQQVFSHCWVPGQKQKQYALKLGFSSDKILTGYYSADVEYFKELKEQISFKKEKDYPHRFIYMGRYYGFKGIQDLWDAFIQWQAVKENDWELWCLGVGDIEPVKHPKIKHFGFIQPKDIAPFLMETSVFVIPSRVEPWGVVLHEFAAAGFPLISSDAVGSAEAFITDGENGYIYPSGNIKKLQESIDRMAALPDKEQREMGKKSAELADKITPEVWANLLMTLLKTQTS